MKWSRGGAVDLRSGGAVARSGALWRGGAIWRALGRWSGGMLERNRSKVKV